MSNVKTREDPAVAEARELRKVLTPEDLAEFLGISVWTVYAKTSKATAGAAAWTCRPFPGWKNWFGSGARILVSWLESREKIDPNDNG